MSELYWGYLTLGPRRAEHGNMCKHGRGRCLNQPERLRVAIQPLCAGARRSSAKFSLSS